jgi:glycosyltransferase involved in cell wall biosynthesis
MLGAKAPGMAQTIENLLADDRQRRRMSQYGKARLRADLLWDNSIPHLLHAYKHLFATAA